ncbi:MULTISPECIES: NmrA/HSCARG family protein [Pseudomonas]|uniref:NmrA/HSCARG family protein n=1 Tax=Pseudomonas TaxID=286 RepID=UPI000D025940|nr:MULTISPECIES: NmrA/HSCARG family protein [Pseudomonas]PRW83614.1 NmrA family protein [Pseudomonas simiae]CAH0141247.1 NAD(P)H azoreductase [Pseudomonas carnis]CAH0151183.1 NAD(P)H azoreductase [Pseudomonas carnis]CAH0210913.1 NAD(P)H azoreductase [Pseudomonas carnis]CAH0224073.1 NAD(P)H azoreductase [Pseudomonas carnis]
MSGIQRSILVFGATGQQGGSVAYALRQKGWRVRALVRDPSSLRAESLSASGVELIQGDFNDMASIRRAMQSIYGVFSVQPSSPGGSVSDEDEIRFGSAVADVAVEHEIEHFVYSSGGAVGDKPTGMGHFDSKALIEAHIRTLPVTATIIRPVTFMEMLLTPGFGLDEGRFNFFMRPDQAMQVLAVEDVGKYVAAIFADKFKFGGRTLDIAGDAITGRDLAAKFTQMAGSPISYTRFSEELLGHNPFLRKLTELMDNGVLKGNADLDSCRIIVPNLQSFGDWLAGTGLEAFNAALGASGARAYST